MSKIIKEGKLIPRRMKCTVCGCEFEYDKRDIGKSPDYSVSQLSYPPKNRYDYYVDCPYCNERHIISPTTIDDMKKEAHSDFINNAQALAKQYGYELMEIKVK